MPKIEARSTWKAKLELEIERIAFSSQYIERGKGTEKKRHVLPTGWLADDNKTLLWDCGKRLKGWIGEVALTVKPSLKDKIRFGMFIHSLSKTGLNELKLKDGGGTATIKDFAPSHSWKEFTLTDLYETNHLPEPEISHLLSGTTGQSIFALYYVLGKPVITEVEIFSFAQIPAEAVRSWLEMMGEYKGLGDLHNAPEGYGTFSVKKFDVIEEGKIKF